MQKPIVGTWFEFWHHLPSPPTAQQRSDGRFDLTCAILEKGKQIFQTTIVVDTENRAIRMRELFMERPEVVYRGTMTLLTGQMNYLFEKEPD